MSLDHAVVWLDDAHAQIIHFDWRHADCRVLPRGTEPLEAWFDALAAMVTDAEEILVAGTGSAPQRFAGWVQQVSPAQRARIFEVQSLGHLADRDLLAHARRYFARVDRPHHIEPDDALAA